MKTSISIETVDGSTGQKKQRSVTDINPSATSEELKTFAQGLVGLTTQNYSSTNRIQVVNVDTESVQGKSIPTFSINSDGRTKIDDVTYDFPYNYDGDGQIRVTYSPDSSPTGNVSSMTVNEQNKVIRVVVNQAANTLAIAYIIGTETTNYASFGLVKTLVIPPAT